MSHAGRGPVSVGSVFSELDEEETLLLMRDDDEEEEEVDDDDEAGAGTRARFVAAVLVVGRVRCDRESECLV